MRKAVASLLAAASLFVADTDQSLVTNGTFDSGALDGWVQTGYTFNGRATDTVTKVADLSLVAVPDASPLILGSFGDERSILPAGLSPMPSPASAGDLPPKLPFAGSGCAGIISSAGTASGFSTSMTVSAEHFSPVDGRLRVRLRALPAFVRERTLPARQESFVLLGVDNATRGTTDLVTYYLGQSSADNTAGVYFQGQNNFGVAMSARHWLDVPLLVPLRAAQEGEQLRLFAVASGCAANAGNNSYAQLYIDSVEAQPSAPMMTAYVPDTVAPSSNFNWLIAVDHGAQASSNVQVQMLVPSGPTFVSASGGALWSCTYKNSVVTCSAASLPASQQSVLSVTLRSGFFDASYLLDSYVLNVNQQMRQTGIEQTTQVSRNRPLTGLRVQSGVRQSAQTPGEPQLVLSVVNDGPAAATGVTFTDVASAALSGRSWSCAASGGAAIAGAEGAAGSGNLQLTLDLPASGAVSCLVRIPANAAPLTTLLRYGGSIDVPASVTDAASWDNEHATVFSLASAGLIANGDTPPGDGTQSNGSSCRQASQCASGICADGVCCQSACAGPCQACDVEGALGVCSPVQGEPHAGHVGCGPYVCQDGACALECTTDEQCTALYHCARSDGAARCVATADICRLDADCPAGRYCTPAGTCESPATQDVRHPAWRLGGGCTSGGDGWLGALLIAPLWAWRRRRRRAARRAISHKAAGFASVLFILGAVWLPPRLVGAASPLAMSIERLQQLGGRNDVFNLASPRIAQQTISAHGQLDLQYLSQPLTLRSQQHNGAQQSVVSEAAVLELGGGAMLSHGFELDAVLPLLWHRTHRAAFFSASLPADQSSVGLGDARVTPKWAPPAWRRLQVGLAVPVSIPTSRGRAFFSTGGFGVAPRLLVEGRLPGRLRILFNAGYLFRPTREVLGLRLQNAIHGSLALAWTLPKRARFVTLLAGSWAEVPTGGPQKAPAAIEGLIGVRARLFAQWSLEATYGASLRASPGLPAARGMLAVRFAERSRAAARAQASPRPSASALRPEQNPELLQGPPYTPPVPKAQAVAPALTPPAPARPASEVDSGVFDAEDALPLLLPSAKTKQSAPLLDRDGDTVPDAVDKCPDVAGAPGGPMPGCPASLLLANQALAARNISFVIVRDYAVLDAGAELLLEEVRQIVAAHAKAIVRITGFVPAVGSHTEVQREHLSLLRAEDVARWLALRGVEKRRMRLEGHGSREPLEAGDSPQAVAKNRRVTVRLEAIDTVGMPPLLAP